MTCYSYIACLFHNVCCGWSKLPCNLLEYFKGEVEIVPVYWGMLPGYLSLDKHNSVYIVRLIRNADNFALKRGGGMTEMWHEKV